MNGEGVASYNSRPCFCTDPQRSLASRAAGDLPLPPHPDGLLARRCSGQRASGRPSPPKPLQKRQLRAPPSPFPSLALCILLAGHPLIPAPRPLPSSPRPPPGAAEEEGCTRVAAGPGPLHGMEGGGKRQVSGLRLGTR